MGRRNTRLKQEKLAALGTPDEVSTYFDLNKASFKGELEAWFFKHKKMMYLKHGAILEVKLKHSVVEKQSGIQLVTAFVHHES